jgi:hypothetical protein
MADNTQLKDGETLGTPYVPAASAAGAAPALAHPSLKEGETLGVPRDAPVPTASAQAAGKAAPNPDGGMWDFIKPSFTGDNMLSNAKQGLYDLGRGAASMGKDVLFPPGKDEGEKLSWLAHKYITDPADREQEKARNAQTPLESIGHSMAEAIPFVGPWAAGLGEQAGTGDVGGAAAKGVTQYLGAKYGPDAIGATTKFGAGLVPKAAEGIFSRTMPTVYSGLQELAQQRRSNRPADPDPITAARTAGRIGGAIYGKVPGVKPLAGAFADHVAGPLADTLDDMAGGMEATPSQVGGELRNDYNNLFGGKPGAKTPFAPPAEVKPMTPPADAGIPMGNPTPFAVKPMVKPTSTGADLTHPFNPPPVSELGGTLKNPVTGSMETHTKPTFDPLTSETPLERSSPSNPASAKFAGNEPELRAASERQLRYVSGDKIADAIGDDTKLRERFGTANKKGPNGSNTSITGAQIQKAVKSLTGEDWKIGAAGDKTRVPALNHLVDKGFTPKQILDAADAPEEEN